MSLRLITCHRRVLTHMRPITYHIFTSSTYVHTRTYLVVIVVNNHRHIHVYLLRVTILVVRRTLTINRCTHVIFTTRNNRHSVMNTHIRTFHSLHHKVRRFRVSTSVRLFSHQFRNITSLLVFLKRRRVSVNSVMYTRVTTRLLTLLGVMKRRFTRVLVPIFRQTCQTSRQQVNIQDIFNSNLHISNMSHRFTSLLIKRQTFDTIVRNRRRFIRTSTTIKISTTLLIRLVNNEHTRQRYRTSFLNFRNTSRQVFKDMMVRHCLQYNNFNTPVQIITLRRSLYFQQNFRNRQSQSRNFLTMVHHTFLVMGGTNAPTRHTRGTQVQLVRNSSRHFFIKVNSFLRAAGLIKSRMVIISSILRQPSRIKQIRLISIKRNRITIRHRHMNRSIIKGLP